MKLLRLLLIPLALAAIAVQAQTYVNPAALPTYELGKATGPGNSYDFATGALIVKDVSGGGGGGGSTTFSTPQSFRLSDGTAWKDFSFGAGAVDANTLRVTLGATGPAVTALNNIDAKTPALQSGATPITAPSALDITYATIITPPTSNLLNTTGTVQAEVTPGGVYTLCISIDNATLGATANTLASATTTAFTGTNLAAARVVAYTGTAPQVGQLLAGTGISPGSYVVSVNAGVSFTMNLPATASGTVTLNVTAGAFAGSFQTSADGSSWTSATVTPRTYSVDQTATTGFVAPGLWQWQAGPTDRFIRFNVTSINANGVAGNLTGNPRLRFNIDALDRPSGRVNLPYVSYLAATAATFPTGIPVIMPVDFDGLSEIAADFVTLTGTSQSITWRQTNDENGVLFQGMFSTTASLTSSTVGSSVTAGGVYRLSPACRFFYASMTAGTAISFNTIGGVTAKVGVQPAIQAVHLTTSPVSANISQIGATTVVNGGLAGTLAVGGTTVEDSASTSNPLITGGVVRTALPAQTNVAGDAMRTTITTSGQQLTIPFAPRELWFQVFTTITTNTQTAIRAAQAAGVRQFITSVTYQNTNATATTITVQDGATTLFTISAPASMANPVTLPFPQPILGSAATALNYTAGTTGANVLFFITGYNSN